MASNLDLERLRPILQLMARKLELDSRFSRRFDSSDLVQETMLKAHQAFSAFRGATEAELLAWLKQILERVTLDHVRRATAQKRDIGFEVSIEKLVSGSLSRLDLEAVSPLHTPGAEMLRQEQLLKLANAVEGLPSDYREAIIRRDINGQRIDEIAREMGRTEKSVAGLLLRGRQKLREFMKRE